MGGVCPAQIQPKGGENMTLAVNIVRAVMSTAFVVLGGLELYALVPKIYQDVMNSRK